MSIFFLSRFLSFFRISKLNILLMLVLLYLAYSKGVISQEDLKNIFKVCKDFLAFLANQAQVFMNQK